MSKNNRNLRTSQLLRVILTAVFITGASAAISQAVPISITNNALDCIPDRDGVPQCKERTIIAAPVTFGLLQYLDMTLIGTIVTNDGEVQPIEETFQVEITKSVPRLTYPLRYFHTVAYAPYEEVRKVPHPSSGCPGCTACGESPTCGWTTHGGVRIPYSQGFCSIKSLEELEHGGCEAWRGEEILGEIASIENPFSTGHAMRLGDIYFDGYEIGEYIKSYEITVKLTKGPDSYQFTLSPSKPYYSSEYDTSYPEGWKANNFSFTAALVGDMDAYEGATELDNYILYIPVSPQSNSMVQDYQHNMLLVPREEVSKDGGEPDKVGVSFHTFRLLGSDCKVSEAGDGLGNQIVNKHNLDIQKLVVNPDAETKYLVHGKQDFKESMGFPPGMSKVLVRVIPHINNSLVSLAANKANTVRPIEFESRGIIRSASIETFPSMSNDGVLTVIIGNAGDVRANYIVTVTDASANILNAFPAQARTLSPQEEATLKFDISTVQNLDTTNKVTVSLRSPTGRMYDSVDVIFDTTKYTTKHSWELRQKNEESVVSLPPDSSPPVITLNGPNTLTLECGIDSYIELGAEAVDETDGNVAVVIGGDTVDTSKCGTYSVIYSAKDSTCNIAHAVRVVEVHDTTAPAITLNGPAEVVLGCGTDEYTEQGATATDNCDDAVAVVIGGGMGEGVVTYNATDSSGNAAEQVTRTIVTGGDTIAPELELAVEPNILWPANNKMVLVKPTWTVSDNCDESPEVTLVSITSSENNKYKCKGPKDKHNDIKIGEDGSIYLRAECNGKGGDRVYTITYQAADDSGNMTVKTVTVEVPCSPKHRWWHRGPF